jgi:hypothetical protein
MPIPLSSQSGSFWIPFSLHQLNISRVDIPCALRNGAGGAVQSTQRQQQVILYITVTVLANTTAANLLNSPPNIPTEADHSPANEATIPRRVQLTAADPPSSLPRQPPIENDIPAPQSREEMSPIEGPDLARHRADEAFRAIVPIDRSRMWESTVERINWVMNTLSPIAEVSVIPFCCP